MTASVADQLPSARERERSEESRQYSTFYLADRLYGIDVTQVQEVTRAMPLTLIRLAPTFIKGLINLRGQIATAIGLRELFGLPSAFEGENMTVVCRVDGNLLSLLVDRIGDVMEVSKADFELAPDTLESPMRKFMVGVYKTHGPILSVVGVDSIYQELNKKY